MQLLLHCLKTKQPKLSFGGGWKKRQSILTLTERNGDHPLPDLGCWKASRGLSSRRWKEYWALWGWN